jgi:hypothetical protein
VNERVEDSLLGYELRSEELCPNELRSDDLRSVPTLSEEDDEELNP